LQGKQKILALLGALALHHPDASRIRSLAQKISSETGAHLGYMTSGANSAGGWLAGAIPHRMAGGMAVNHAGLDAYAMLHKPRDAYVLLNVEPDLDCANALLATEALRHASCVVALSLYRHPLLEATADVILPIASFTETSGTFINTSGEWQSFTGVAKAFAASRPAWKVLRVLGNFLELKGFDYESSEAVKHEVQALIEKMPAVTAPLFHVNDEHSDKGKLSRIGEVPLYSIDSLVRHSQPLQDAQIVMEGDVAVIRLHPETARKFNLQDGDSVVVKQASASALMSLKSDSRIAENAAWIAAGVLATKELGDLFGQVEIEKG